MKKIMMTIAAAALMTVGFAGAADAQHHSGGFHGGGVRSGGIHGGIRGGFGGRAFVGAPFVYDPFWYAPYWDFYYPNYAAAYNSPYPYYYPPNTDYGPPGSGASPAQGWYYCTNPQGYYPSVPYCNSQWRYVPPAPPPPS
jgi:hypothetical protein